MRPQRALIRAGKLTLVAFVRIFPQPTAEEGFTIDPVSIQEGYRKDVNKIYGRVEHWPQNSTSNILDDDKITHVESLSHVSILTNS